MATRRKMDTARQRARLKLRAAILNAKEKKEQAQNEERKLRSQLKGL